MKSIRVSIDFDVEYDDTEPGAFAYAMAVVDELLSLEIDGDGVKIVQTRSKAVKPPIKLKKLLEVLQACYDKHADAPECQEAIEVEFWRGDEELELARIGQFGVKPDVMIRFN